MQNSHKNTALNSHLPFYFIYLFSFTFHLGSPAINFLSYLPSLCQDLHTYTHTHTLRHVLYH